jgi:Phage gp6-like head-tail connector protein
MPLDGRYQISRVITPAASIDLVTLDQAKAALGITDSSQDAAISQHITQISAAINRFCNRVFVEQTYRDQFRALYNWLSPGAPLMTRQAPIALDDTGLPLAIVTENGAVIDPAAWEVDPSTGQFYRLDGATVLAWTGTTVLIDYTAGFDPVPPDVQAAALEWLGVQYHSGYGRDPSLRSETIPDLITQTWDTSPAAMGSATTAVPAPVAHLLSGYRIWFL